MITECKTCTPKAPLSYTGENEPSLPTTPRHLSDGPLDGRIRETQEGDCPVYMTFDRTTGLLLTYGKRCESSTCSECLAWKCQRVLKALHLAQPEHLVTINEIPRGPLFLKAFRRNIIRLIPTWREATHKEPYTQRERSTMIHSHAWTHGTQGLSQDRLLSAVTSAASRAGAEGHVDVRPVTSHHNLGYGLKMVSGDLATTTTREAYLDTNDGHLVHTSRGFWRVGGESVSGGLRNVLRTAA